MKIGITCYPTYGGSGVVATELGIELAAAGHQIHFIAYSQPFRLRGREQDITFHEVPVSNYPLFEYPPYDLALATRMAEVAAYYELDLLHVHYAIPHSISAYLAREMLARQKRRLPFITTLHGTDITLVGLDHSYLPITRFGIDESDGVTAISTYLKDKTVQEFHPQRSIHVIPNFVNCDVYQPFEEPECSARRARYAEPGEKLLVHLSNFRPVKRTADVVRIFSRVARELPARLLMIGDGPDRSAAEWIAHRKGYPGPGSFSGKAEQRLRNSASRRSAPDAERAGVFRTWCARGHGLPRTFDCNPRGRGSRSSSRMELTGGFFPLAMWKEWPQPRPSYCATPNVTRRWRKRPGKLRRPAIAPRRSFRCTSDSTKKCLAGLRTEMASGWSRRVR